MGERAGASPASKATRASASTPASIEARKASAESASSSAFRNEAERSAAALLRLPGFVQLLCAYVLNELAWSVGTLALSVVVYRRTGSAIGSAGFFLCSQAAPALTSPWLVARLDRHPTRRVLPVLYGLEAVLFGALAWLTHRFALAPVLVLTVVDGTIALTARALASAARAAILRPVNRLREGNTLVGTLFSVAYLIGPLIGAGVVALGGTVDALLVNCGMFAGMTVMLTSSSIPSASPDEHSAADRRLRQGFARVRADRLIATLFTLQSVGLVFFALSIPVEVVFADHTLHAGPSGYGALMAAWGGGAVIGSAAFGRLNAVSARLVLGGFALVAGIGYAVLAGAPDLVVGLAGAAIAGSANGGLAVAFPHEIQDRSPQAWTAMITSLIQGSAQASLGVGIALGGLIAALATPRAAFAVGAAGSVAVAALIFTALNPQRVGSPESPSAETPLAPAETPAA